MTIKPLPLDHQYILNYSAKYLARSDNSSNKHFCFPLIDNLYNNEDENRENQQHYNRVTFIFKTDKIESSQISVYGSFAEFYKPIELQNVKFNNTSTMFYAVSLALPHSQSFRYRFNVNGQHIIDPANSYTIETDNGNIWSGLLTENYRQIISLESWEAKILQRLCAFILPFNTNEFSTFLKSHGKTFDDTTLTQLDNVFNDLGTVNYIDKILVKEEAHHLIDYKLCLREIHRVLLILNPFMPAAKMPDATYQGIFQIMASNDFSIWNRDIYDNPNYFLKILRRHSIVSAFSHPKYGGNINALGWKFLAELLRDPESGQDLFDWRKSLEKPIGVNNDYIG